MSPASSRSISRQDSERRRHEVLSYASLATGICSCERSLALQMFDLQPEPGQPGDGPSESLRVGTAQTQKQ